MSSDDLQDGSYSLAEAIGVSSPEHSETNKPEISRFQMFFCCCFVPTLLALTVYILFQNLVAAFFVSFWFMCPSLAF